MSNKLSRESFYALLWDKVPEHFRGAICAFANIGSGFALLEWDELDDDEVKRRVRNAIFDFVEAHENNRALARQRREARRPARAA